MKYSLGHYMEPRVLFQTFQIASASSRIFSCSKKSSSKKKGSIKKKKKFIKKINIYKKERCVLSSLLSFRERINIGHLGSSKLLDFFFSSWKLVLGVTNTIYHPSGLHTGTWLISMLWKPKPAPCFIIILLYERSWRLDEIPQI